MSDEKTLPRTGKPITEEMQMIFGEFGVVTGIHKPHDSGAITVHYEGDIAVQFLPIYAAEVKQP